MRDQDAAKKRGRAMVFALYGTGNAPLRKDSFIKLVERAVKAGIPVTVTTQCVRGRTQLDAYATGVTLLEMGVITSFDMTVEACVSKLAYLMGKGFRGKALKDKMETDLRGELSVVDALPRGEDVHRRARENRQTVVRFGSH